MKVYASASGLAFARVAWAAACTLWLGLAASPAMAQTLDGIPERIADGDTLTVGGETVRLWGIDAPELKQTCTRAGETYPCGEVARYVLISLVKGKQVRCQARERDRYGRVVASCRINGDDLGGAMVRAGQAVDFTRYSQGAYAEAERHARREGKGLWAGSFVDPGEWRQRH
jgi:endonuclease YncB( thermonuclease family)